MHGVVHAAGAGAGGGDGTPPAEGVGVFPTSEGTPPETEDASTDVVVLAEDAPASGTLEDNLTWSLDAGTLTISGNGEMVQSPSHSMPWLSYEKSIETIVVEDGVTTICDSAFYAVSNLKSVTIPGSVTTIGKNAFFRCANLTEVSIQNGLHSIGESAFAYCSALSDINLPASLQSIGDHAFEQCGLKNITVDSGNSDFTVIDGVLFDSSAKTLYCYPGGKNSISEPGEYTIPQGVTSIAPSALKGCSLSAVNIPDSVTTIGDGAFANNLMTSITIPASVTSIGNRVFSYCHLEKFVVEEGNTAFCTRDGALLSKDGTKFYCYPYRRDDSTYTVPEGVVTIEAEAFRGTRLTSVEIPEGVTEIKEQAFQNCIDLTSISLPASLKTIGSFAFSDCRVLKSIDFGGTDKLWEQISKLGAGIPDDATIHCRGITVTFNAGDGTLTWDQKSKVVETGKAYGTLPIPTRTDYTFAGWFTAASGGERVTANTTVTASGAHTLYARWRGGNLLPELTYNFSNSHSGFQYPNPYRIPLERYIQVFGNTARAYEIFKSKSVWGGSCFGMSTTSTMFNRTDNDISVRNYNSGASKPKDLAVLDSNGTMPLRNFIEAMQISQYSGRIQEHYRAAAVSALCEHFESTGYEPFVVAIWGSVGDGAGGHAMVAYDLVDVSADESHLKVYDPNYPNDVNRYITLRKSNGVYTGWYYHLNDTYHWGTGYPYERIAFVPYTDYYEIWMGLPVPYMLSDRRAAASQEADTALLFLNSKNAVITDQSGTQIATITDGALSTARDDIFLMQIAETLAEGETSGSDTTTIFLPPDLYTVRDTDTGSGSEPFEATMVHVDQAATVSTTGNTVTFAVNDESQLSSAKVSGSGAAYTVTMSSTLKPNPDGMPETTTATGTVSGQDASVTQFSGKLYTENIAESAVKVNGNPVASGTVQDGSTLDVPSLVRGLTAALQADGRSAVLSSAVSGVRHVYAAAYDANHRMTGVVSGSLEGTTVRFENAVSKGSLLFLLDEHYVPVCAKITLE